MTSKDVSNDDMPAYGLCMTERNNINSINNLDPKDVYMWPLLSVLKKDFHDKLNLVYTFGSNATELLVTTLDDQVYALGCNVSGCFGCGDTFSSIKPRHIEALDAKKLTSIVAGSGPHVLALTDGGDVYCWGHNSYQQLGNGGTAPVYCPIILSPYIGRQIKQIACGSHHSMALTVDGEVFTWGYNNCGQIGSGSTCNQGSPRKVNFIGSMVIVHISCGQTSSVAVSCAGEVWSWGYNGNGQLGIGNNVNQSQPCKVTSLLGIVIKKVVCGYAHALALTDDGKLFGWGANSYGQLGSGSKANSVTPVRVGGELERVVNVAATHYSHTSAAQNSKGQVYMWGQLRSQSVAEPQATNFSVIDAVFAAFSSPPVSWQPMKVGEQVGPTIGQSIARAFDNQDTADLKISVEGKIIHVHKAVLKIRCDYFRRMFQSHWDESKQDTVELNGYSYAVAYSFLRWLYTDHVELPPEDAIGLLDLATSYCEDELKAQCEKLIKESISVDNAAMLYAAAIKYQAQDLRWYCFQFCLNHMCRVVQTENFSLLDKDTMYDFIRQAAVAGVFRK